MNNQVFEISLCGVMVLLIFKLQKNVDHANK